MNTIDLTEAEARFRALIGKAEAGETVIITRNETPVAQLSPAQISSVSTVRQPIDFAALRELTNAMPFQKESAGDFIRRMRDEDRY